ncbi:hypothetical protein ACVFYP_08280 [Roseomonas sp. F4]
MTASCGRAAPPPGASALALGTIALSPDGETAAFQFWVPGRAGHGGMGSASGLGLYQWRSGALLRIPNPPGLQLGYPTFTDDGRRLVCLHGVFAARDYWEGVSAIDLPGLAHRVLVPRSEAPASRQIQDVAVQPGTGALLCSVLPATGTAELLLWPAAGGGWGDGAGPRTVVPAPELHLYVDSLAFVGPEEVLFQGLSARNPALVGQLEAIGLAFTNTAIWRVRFGGRPELFFPRTAAEVFPPGHWSQTGSASGVAASRGGSVVLTVGRSRERPTGPRGEFLYEVLRVRPDGRAEAVTRLLGVMNRVAVSADGRVAGFLEDTRRTRDPRAYDLWTLDLGSGDARATGLRARLASDPAFAAA